MIDLSFVNICNILFLNRSSIKIISLHVLTYVPVVPPSIADEPTEIVVTRLSPVVIACTASGVPQPTIHWSKDGMKLPKEGQGYSILPTGQNLIKAKNIQKYTTFIEFNFPNFLQILTNKIC